MPILIKQSTTGTPLPFFLTSSSDHISGLTGKAATVAVKISKNGATGVTPSGAISEIDATNNPGWYAVAGNATDTGTLGPIILSATVTGADPCDMLVAQVVAFDPTNANLGLSNVSANVAQWNGSNVAAPATAGIPDINVKNFNNVTAVSLPTNFASLSIDVSGRVDLGKILGTASAGAAGYVGLDWGHITAAATAVNLSATTIQNLNGNTVQTGDAYARLGAPVGASTSADIAALKSDLDGGVNTTKWGGTAVGTIPPDVVLTRNGTAQAGGASSITLDAGASATNNFYNNAVIFIRSGTGAGQTNVITGYVGSTKVATVGTAWAAAPDATSVFSIAAFGPGTASVSGTVNANVVQWNGQTALTDSNNLPKVDVEAINASTGAAQNVSKANQAIGRGTCTTGGTTTSIPTSAWSIGGAGVVSGQFIGCTMIFDANTTTASLQGQRTNITANTSGATPTFTVTALTTAPSSGDTFMIV